MKNLILLPVIFVLAVLPHPTEAIAYGECTQYGIWSYYDSTTRSCKCTSGYIFGKFLGSDYCVSKDQYCTDKYGYNSKYDSFTGSCGCRSGYIMDGGKCTDGNSVCRADHGWDAEYNSLKNTCGCRSGYTFDDSNKCVKKQNNVYFTLKEINTDEKQAIIRSQYDYGYYLIKYGYGCYSSSFNRYLNDSIVVNLGTDFSVDTFDKIVLQDDNETCDITRVSRANSSTTLYPDDGDTNSPYILNTTPRFTPNPKPLDKSVEPVDDLAIEKTNSEQSLLDVTDTGGDNATITNDVKTSETYNAGVKKPENKIIAFFKKVGNWFKSLFK